MKIVNPKLDLDKFFKNLEGKESSLLMFDYDGTLAPFVTDRNAAYPYPEAWSRINKLIRMGRTDVVIVTGRMIESLMNLIPKDSVPEIWGSHGFERWSSESGFTTFSPSKLALEGVGIAHNLSLSYAGNKHVERKGSSVVVHWRALSNDRQKEIHDVVLAKWQPLLNSYPLEILEFDGGIEIRAFGRNKGDVVNEVMAEKKCHGAAAYLGDDTTDEDAFDAMAGKGLRVLVKKKSHITNVDIQIEPPNELLMFLDRWIAATGGK